MVKSSETGGVKPMSIAGRYVRERERLLGMTEEERAWRAQWLKDQHLSANEPRHIPEIYKELYNPIRRLYRAPLDAFGQALTPLLGKQNAMWIRILTGRFIMFTGGLMIFLYHMKYNSNDWTRLGGFRVLESRRSVLQGDPGYPKLSDRSAPSDYASRGFKDCNLTFGK